MVVARRQRKKPAKMKQNLWTDPIGKGHYELLLHFSFPSSFFKDAEKSREKQSLTSRNWPGTHR